jgi:hypothetical protein
MFLQWVFLQPKICYRKYYTMDKFNKECSCLFICKYPPPKKLAPSVKEFNIEEFKISTPPS